MISGQHAAGSGECRAKLPASLCREASLLHVLLFDDEKKGCLPDSFGEGGPGLLSIELL